MDRFYVVANEVGVRIAGLADWLFGCGEDLLGDGLRHDVVVIHLQAEAAAALRHGRERGAVGEDF